MQDSVEVSAKPSRIGAILLGLCGLIPLLGLLTSSPLNPLLMVSVFTIAWFLRARLTGTVSAGQPIGRFAVAMFFSTLLLEVLSWFNNYLARNPKPALFHPQLIPDLLIAVGFYTAWTIAWAIVLRRYRFSVREVFILTGIYGIFIEQQGAIFLAGLASLPVGVLLWLYVFGAYGSTVALAYLPFRNQFGATGNSRWKYPLILVLLWMFSLLVSFVWGLVLAVLHVIPPPRPIGDFPLY